MNINDNTNSHDIEVRLSDNGMFIIATNSHEYRLTGFYSIQSIAKLHKYLGEQIQLQQQKENTEMREKFTIAKLLIALKNRNECQMLSLNSSEQADLIPEVEKLLSELEKLQQENRNAKIDNQKLYKEIEKLKSKIEELTGKYHYQLQVNDGLTNKNRSLEMNSDCWEKAKSIIKLIPNPESYSPLKLLESFVKNALAKDNRIDGKLYAAKFHNAFEPTAIKWDGVGKFWYWYGNDIQYTDSFFEWISDAPIDLEVENEQ